MPVDGDGSAYDFLWNRPVENIHILIPPDSVPDHEEKNSQTGGLDPPAR